MLFKELRLKYLSAFPIVFLLGGFFAFSWDSYGGEPPKEPSKEHEPSDGYASLRAPYGGFSEQYPYNPLPLNQFPPINYGIMQPPLGASWDLRYNSSSSSPFPPMPHQPFPAGIERQTQESTHPMPFETMPEGTDIEVLVLGQTGSGKTTFLNTAANYFLFGSFGVDPRNQKVKVIIPTKYLQPTEKGFSHSEHNVHNQAKSQTKNARCYQLAVANRTVTFIDTPGMGDTEGIDRDEKHLTQILKKAAKHKKLSGIILFFNGAEPRDTATKMYTFNKLKGAIPDIALKNMIVVLTNTYKESSSFPKDQIKALGVSEDRIFYMNNTLWACDPKLWNDITIAHRLVQDWHNSMTTMGEICMKLSASSGAINKEFKKMFHIRNYIMHEFHKVRLQFAEMQNTQSVIETFREKFQSESAVADDFKDFAQKAKIKTRKFVHYSDFHYSTICTIHHTICHDQCSLSETHTVGDEIFTGCAAFNGSKNGSRCGTCSSSDCCSYKNHYHARGKFEEVEETLQDQLDEYKKRYEEASQAAQGAKADADSAEAALEQMKATIDSFAQEVKEKLEDLKKICSGYNFVAELNSTIQLLKQETKRFTSTEVLNSANDLITELELVANRLTEQSSEQSATGDSYGSTGFGYLISGEELNEIGQKRALLSYVRSTITPVSIIKGIGRKRLPKQ